METGQKTSFDFWAHLKQTVYGPNFSMANLVDIKKYIKRPYTIKKVSESYLGRFDLASYDVYKRPYLWWVILAVNDIENPFDPEVVGRDLIFPHIQDIIDFIMDLRVKKERAHE